MRVAVGRAPIWRNLRASYYVMLVPALVLLMGVLYPFVLGVYTSFTNEKLYLADTRFVGFANYIDLFQTELFRTSVLNTLVYTLLVISIQIPLGLLVAMLLEVPTPLRAFFRSTVVLPLLVPPVVAGLMWKTMMQPQSGILNWVLGEFGLPPFLWLTDVRTALLSVVAIDTWVFMPFSALILLAGLQSVPTESIEAARVDGANGWQIFRSIQLPWILPYILLVLLFRTADALKSFELIYATTRGGPLNATRTLHIMAYEETYRWSNLGRAMAIVFVLWLTSYIVSAILLRLWRDRARTQDAS